MAATTDTINTLTLKAVAVALDELELQETAGGTSKKTTALAVAKTLLALSTAEFAGSVGATALQLAITPAPSHSEGLIAYDSDIKGFVGYVDESEVTLNIGEEHWIRVRNNSGATILNGQVVYISGAIGQKPTIALAKADAAATSQTIGVATHDILNNSNGIITVSGLVRDLDTSGFTEGDNLYLSDSVAGELTATKPTATAFYKVPVGHVTYSNPSAGAILIAIGVGLDHSDIAGTGNMVTVGYAKAKGFVSDETDMIRVMFPSGGSYRGTADKTGAIKIRLPVSWTNTMMKFVAKVYDHVTGESFDVHIAGFNPTGTTVWENVTAYIVGDASVDRNFTVRFGHDGTYCCVYIGELASVWGTPQVTVTEFIGGYSGGITNDLWNDNWDVTFEASAFGTITATVNTDQLGRSVDGNIIWHAGNDGLGSDLDAGKLAGTVISKGTFTPILFGGTTAGTPTYTIQTGRFTELYDRMIITGRVKISARGGIDGQIRIGGLPVLSDPTANNFAPVNCGSSSGLAITAGTCIQGLIYPNNNIIYLTSWDSVTGSANLVSSKITDTVSFMFFATYSK